MWGSKLRFTLIAAGIFGIGCPDRGMDRARDLAREGRIKEAAEMYVDIARSDPANLGAWDKAIELWCRHEVNVGECLETLDLENELLGTVQRHRDALSEVLELRARARAESGLAEAGLQDLERAENAAPERSTVFSARARALMMLGRTDEAAAALDHALKLNPKNEEANLLMKDLPARDAPPAPGGPDDGFGGAR